MKISQSKTFGELADTIIKPKAAKTRWLGISHKEFAQAVLSAVEEFAVPYPERLHGSGTFWPFGPEDNGTSRGILGEWYVDDLWGEGIAGKICAINSFDLHYTSGVFYGFGGDNPRYCYSEKITGRRTKGRSYAADITAQLISSYEGISKKMARYHADELALKSGEISEAVVSKLLCKAARAGIIPTASIRFAQLEKPTIWGVLDFLRTQIKRTSIQLQPERSVKAFTMLT